MTDEQLAAVNRREALDRRWNEAATKLWLTKAEYALQLDHALTKDLGGFLRDLTADNGSLAHDVRGLALLAWDELCETPDPRKLPPPIEA